MTKGRYTGLWRRETIQIEGGEPHETAVVLWLQVDAYFADLRIPFERAFLPAGQSLADLPIRRLRDFAGFSAFAGSIEATADWIRWNRTIDFRPRPGQLDQGRVHREDSHLIEIGEFARPDGSTGMYKEIWVPQPCASPDVLVLELSEPVDSASRAIRPAKGMLVRLAQHFTHIYDPRGYPPDFEAPDPQDLSEPELRRLLDFQADYGCYEAGSERWQILLSSDPGRVGEWLPAPIRQANQTWLQTLTGPEGFIGERRWLQLEPAVERAER
ncbi:hypothetical protein [Gloeobacter violaceus]|uniref:Gll4345 protein n=1 Tax=Gloeobacter violaceus (strain ATCC 29082 / PCC 7421) TaxID=251221 RepID=Q7ND91_GLOVI|nr:hypothetical protein [Gloeobacter violaceus]BAC92286.1 gll4345 [Gloeobacter violaceus PCC 7421]